MVRTLALLHLPVPASALPDLARKAIVLGCALALIFAGNPLPF